MYSIVTRTFVLAVEFTGMLCISSPDVTCFDPLSWLAMMWLYEDWECNILFFLIPDVKLFDLRLLFTSDGQSWCICLLECK